MRRLALIAALLAGAGSALAATAVGEDSHTYFIELDNAFGLVDGSEVKVAGVTQGVVEDLFINSNKRAVVKATLSGELSQLGEDTICSSEPQSLIAEYFLDCNPKGPPIDVGQGADEDRAEEPDVPVEQTRQTVQSDLVQSALRQSYKERLAIIINEFGTALAGNPDNLNAAIRRGAPALTQFRKVTKILGQQNTIIRDLNENSDTIFVQLAERRKDVREFVERARDTAAASAERRADLSRNFEILDDFLAELEPTMFELNRLAVAQTPLLRDLRLASGGLNTLAQNLPGFNSASEKSLLSLASAARVGERALRKGTDELDQLRRSSRRANSAANHLVKFLRDIDDPDRAVAEDTRAAEDTGDPDRVGYTGLEGLLNYVYYQTGAINQFDEVSHLLHFSIFEIESTPCSEYNATQEVPNSDGDPFVPKANKADFEKLHRCVAWLGPNQPGINDGPELPPYHPSVCKDGSTDTDICDPSGTTSAEASRSGLRDRARDAKGVRGGKDGQAPGLDVPGLDDLGGGGGGGGGARDGLPGLGDGLPLPKANEDLRGVPKLGRGTSRSATRDLLGFLFDD